MNKRDIVMSLLDGAQAPLPYIPAAFFMHFPPASHAGQAAADKHLDYFRYTDMDFIKIQYECTFPPLPQIRRPEDWAAMPHYGPAFFEGQLKAVRALVKAGKREALVIQTLYSPFMCAQHTVGPALLTAHLNQAPELVARGMAVIADSLRGFVRACARLGVDGFYTSSKGAGGGRFADAATFARHILPFDLELMGEAQRAGQFNILHACDCQGAAEGAQQRACPGHVVSCALNQPGGPATAEQAASQFRRPFMGGLERKGVLLHGTREELGAAIAAVRDSAPPRFMLGADCTVAADTPWERLRLAVALAHGLAPRG